MANAWSSGGFGNYWHDWTMPDADMNGIVDTPYPLDPGGSADPYPLTTWTVIPEPGILFLSLIMMAICLGYIRIKREPDA